jgi:uncharacterized protein YidB (DUF937 family)
MGLLDSLKGSFGGILGEAETAALPMIVARVFPNGLQGLLDQLQQSGLGAKVSSWVGNGPNQPITVDELRAALSNEHVQQLAQSLGIPADKVLEVLSAHLPAAVDRQSPDGTLQEPTSSS